MMDELTNFCDTHRLPPSVRTAWAARGITGWTPLQTAAWAQGLAGSGEPDKTLREHWLVCAPTSAGKGLLAEVAATLRLLRGEKVIWLAPTRALAEMVHAQFAQTLAGLGLRLICSTHDRPGGDGPALRGQFDLLVGVYEKIQGWLLRQPHGLAEVGLIVADELTALRDPERGGRLDLLLATLMASPYEPRRLGLCLPVPNLAQVADWWLGGPPVSPPSQHPSQRPGGRVLVSHDRPRALREGVLDATTGRLRWRDRAGGETGEEALALPGQIESWLAAAREVLHEADWPPLQTATAALAAGLALRGEPTLLFATSRPQARAWAAGLAQGFDLPPAGGAILHEAAALARCDPGHDHRLLAETLAHGVGLHHADLSPPARRLVEQAYCEGQVRLLIATPTLSQGMNFAALNAIHWPERMEPVPPGDGRRTFDASWRKAPLERWRFIDQGGRAARFGAGETPGRSLLVAWGAAPAERLWQHYLVKHPEPLVSRLNDADLATGVLNTLAGDVARTSGNLAALFGATLAGQTQTADPGENPAVPEPALAQKISIIIERCRDLELLKTVPLTAGREPNNPTEPEERLRLTGLGQVCATQGITPEILARLRPWLADESLTRALNGQDTPDAPLPALWALSLCAPEGLWPAGQRGGSPIAGQVRGWFEERQEQPPAPLAELLTEPGGPDPAAAAALEAGWRLAWWIGPEPTEQIEARTGWTAGMLARAGEGLAWLARAAGAVGLARGLPLAVNDGWQALATRLATGAPPKGLALARLKVEDLSRTGILALCADGLSEPAMLADAPLDLLERHLGDPALARRLREAARQAVSRRWRLPGIGRPSFAINHPSRPGKSPVTAWEWRPSPAQTPMPAPIPNEFKAIPPGTPAKADCLLEIDLQSPGVVRLAGREVRLRPLSFDLLATLAERPGKVVTREALYQRLWPDGGVEDQQLDAHRRRLSSELRQIYGPAGEAMLEVVRGMGLRLKLGAEEVRLLRG